MADRGASCFSCRCAARTRGSSSITAPTLQHRQTTHLDQYFARPPAAPTGSISGLHAAHRHQAPSGSLLRHQPYATTTRWRGGVHGGPAASAKSTVVDHLSAQCASVVLNEGNRAWVALREETSVRRTSTWRDVVDEGCAYSFLALPLVERRPDVASRHETPRQGRVPLGTNSVRRILTTESVTLLVAAIGTAAAFGYRGEMRTRRRSPSPMMALPSPSRDRGTACPDSGSRLGLGAVVEDRERGIGVLHIANTF